MASVTMVACDKEGGGNNGKSDDGNKGNGNGDSKVSKLVHHSGAAKKNQMKRAPMSNFHSLSTYVDHTNFKSYFPRQLGHFFCSHVFFMFFLLKLIRPHRNLVWFGGYQNECFSLIEQLTFQLNSFSQKSCSYTKFTQCISAHKELTIPGHFSSSLNLICMWIQLLKVRNEQKSLGLHGGRDDSILSAKIIRIVPENSSF